MYSLIIRELTEIGFLIFSGIPNHPKGNIKPHERTDLINFRILLKSKFKVRRKCIYVFLKKYFVYLKTTQNINPRSDYA